jgi:hypothetical protein
MSSPLLPTSGLSDQPAGIDSSGLNTSPSLLGLLPSVPAIGARRLRPPADVLAEVADAGAVHDQLLDEGHELHFSTPGDGERVTVMLCDSEGNPIRSVSLTEAFEIAAGKQIG